MRQKGFVSFMCLVHVAPQAADAKQLDSLLALINDRKANGSLLISSVCRWVCGDSRALINKTQRIISVRENMKVELFVKIKSSL